MFARHISVTRNVSQATIDVLCWGHGQLGAGLGLWPALCSPITVHSLFEYEETKLEA